MFIGSRLSQGGHLFLDHFLEPLFWSTGLNSDPKMVPKWDPVGLFFRPFSKTWKPWFWRPLTQFRQVEDLKIALWRNTFSRQFPELVLGCLWRRLLVILGPKKVPNWWLFLGGGASWGTFGAPSNFWTQMGCPKCPQKCPVGAKMTPKRVPITPKVAKCRPWTLIRTGAPF